MKLDIRPAGVEDLDQVLMLNQAALPHVNSIGREQLERLAAMACFFSVAVTDSRIAGFLLALREGADYASENYRWFCRCYPSFVYVDRIVVEPGHARLGVGRRLYEDLLAASVQLAPRLTCEVNLEPPNPGSIAFHQRLGFREVGRQQTEGGSKRVVLMCRPWSV